MDGKSSVHQAISGRWNASDSPATSLVEVHHQSLGEHECLRRPGERRTEERRPGARVAEVDGGAGSAGSAASRRRAAGPSVSSGPRSASTQLQFGGQVQPVGRVSRPAARLSTRSQSWRTASAIRSSITLVRATIHQPLRMLRGAAATIARPQDRPAGRPADRGTARPAVPTRRPGTPRPSVRCRRRDRRARSCRCQSVVPMHHHRLQAEDLGLQKLDVRRWRPRRLRRPVPARSRWPRSR